MNHSSFIQKGWIGNKILTGRCNYTTYYNTTTMETIKVPFVPCDQVYNFGEMVFSLDTNVSGIEV